MKKIINVSLILLSILFVSCNQKEVVKSETKDSANVDSAQENYKHLLAAVNWYSRSAEMRACYYQAYNIARLQLTNHLKKATDKKKKAVVFDIDETLLNNTPFEIKSIETNLGYSKETWTKWTSLSRAVALPGALAFLDFAKSKGVEVFYVTNRRNEEKAATVKNLDSLKFPYLDETHLLFRTDEASKEKRRKTISENYEIVLLVGDNLSDFSDVFENRDENFGIKNVDDNSALFGEKYIILPNPMYGDWEMAIYGKGARPTDSEKAKLLENGLKSEY